MQWAGGKSALITAAVLGVLGLGLTAFGITRDADVAFRSVQLAFAYWSGLAFGSLLLVAVLDATGSRWFTLLRAQTAHHGAAAVVCSLAFGTVALRHLDDTYYLARSLGYCAVAVLAWLLLERGASKVKGAVLAPLLTAALLGSGGDWADTTPLYWLLGAVLSALALVLAATLVPTDAKLPGARATTSHMTDLGGLMLLGTCAWGWAAFTELQRHTGHGWRPLVVLLVLGRFVLPFLALAARAARKSRKLLTALAVWTLAMQLIDVFWMIKSAQPLEAGLAWTDVTAWLGLGGLCLGFVVLQMRGRPRVVDGPDLEYSLTYRH